MNKEHREQMALLRYKIISPFLAEDPPRGLRFKMIEKLAGKLWTMPDGTERRFAADTIRLWLRSYRKEGLDGLLDKSREGGGTTIPSELLEEACRLKREVPERTIEQIILIMEKMGHCVEGVLSRSGLHRALRERGLSGRPKAPRNRDLARFAADFANDLWQADMMVGPWLPDPAHPGRKRRTYLYAFIDDASRLVPAGLFFFKGDLPSLEMVMKRAVRRHGVPVRVYYDNGMVFRSRKMHKICAGLGIHRQIFTAPYRPQGHGKIEAFNRFCKSRFVAEVKASSTETVEELNRAFIVWLDQDYNRRVHGELGTTPHERWHRDIGRIRYVDEQKLRRAFLFQLDRTVDKCGVFRLHGHSYQADWELAGRKVQVHYDPESLEQVEVFRNGSFLQKARPLKVTPSRPPKKKVYEDPSPEGPATDYLGFLAAQHREQNQEHIDGLTPFISLLKDMLDERVFDEELARAHWESFGPLDLEEISRKLADLLEVHPSTHHIGFYLDRLKPRGGTS